MFRVTLTCLGIPETSGTQAAVDITDEFIHHRPWHINARCTWDGTLLVLEAENDFDENGLASLDEFADAISGCVSDAGEGDILIEVVEFDDSSTTGD